MGDPGVSFRRRSQSTFAPEQWHHSAARSDEETSGARMAGSEYQFDAQRASLRPRLCAESVQRRLAWGGLQRGKSCHTNYLSHSLSLSIPPCLPFCLCLSQAGSASSVLGVRGQCRVPGGIDGKGELSWTSCTASLPAQNQKLGVINGPELQLCTSSPPF